MEANRSRPRWTWAEFARLPSEEGVRHEVIGDELLVTPSPSLSHQRVVRTLMDMMHHFALDHDLGEVFPGPVDVLLAEGDFLGPDLVFVRKERAAALYSDRGIEGPPDLVVEIVSPSTAARDRTVKLERYRRFGVPEYWIVDPERRTFEVRLTEDGEGIFEPGDAVEWTPVGGGPTLRVEVEEVIGGP